MKKLLSILLFIFITHISFAQDDQQGGRLKEKMVEYIQNKLGLSKDEAERFRPMFMDYLRDLRKANQEFKDDPLKRQQKIVEVRIRFRDQWKPVVGEKRSNEVFNHEREFVQKVREVHDERMQQHPENSRANKRKGAEL